MSNNKVIKIKGIVDIDLNELRSSLSTAKSMVESFVSELTQASQIQIGASLANAEAISDQIRTLNEGVSQAAIQANQAAADAQVAQAKQLSTQQIDLAESHNAKVTQMAEELVAKQKAWLEEEHQKQLQLVKDTYAESIVVAKQLADARAEMSSKEQKEAADRDLKLQIATQKDVTTKEVAENKLRESHYQARQDREFKYKETKKSQEFTKEQAEANRASAENLARISTESAERVSLDKAAADERVKTHKSTLDAETKATIAENALRESHFQAKQNREFKYRETKRAQEIAQEEAENARVAKASLAEADISHKERMKNIQVEADAATDRILAETKLRATEIEQAAETQRNLQLRLSEQMIDANRELELSKRTGIIQTEETRREEILSTTLLEKTKIQETEQSRRDSITALTAIQIASIQSTHQETVEKLRLEEQARKDTLQAMTVMRLAEMAEAHQKEITNINVAKDLKIAADKDATINRVEEAKRHNEIVINDLKESAETERQTIKSAYDYRTTQLKSFIELKKTQIIEAANTEREAVAEARKREDIASKERIANYKAESQKRIESIRTESKERINASNEVHQINLTNLKNSHDEAINNSKLEEAQRSQDSKQLHEKQINDDKERAAVRHQEADNIHKIELTNIVEKGKLEKEQIKSNTTLALKKLDQIHQKEITQMQLNYDMIANMRLRRFTAEENQKDRIHEKDLSQAKEAHELKVQQISIEAQQENIRFAESRKMIAARAKERKDAEAKAIADAAKADAARAAKEKADLEELSRIREIYNKSKQDSQKADDDTAAKFRRSLEKIARQRQSDIEKAAKLEADNIKKNEALALQSLKRQEQEKARFHRAFFSRMENGWKGMERTISKVFSTVFDQAKQLAQQAAQAIVGIVDKSIQSYAALDSSLSTVRAISQPGEANPEVMEILKQTIMTVDLELPLNVNQVGEAVETLKRAGFEIKEIIKLTPYVGKLATATASDVAVTADVVSAFSNTFRDVEPELLMNQIMVAANNSNQTIEDLLQSIISLKGAMQMDESKDFLAMTMTLADAGMSGSNAGTAIHNAQNFAEKPENQKLLEEMGVQVFNDDEGRIQADRFFRDVIRAAKSHTDEARTVFREIFQERGVALINNSIKKTEAELDFNEELLNKAGTGATGETELDKATAVQMQGFAGTLKTLESTIGGFFVKLGDGLSHFVQAAGMGMTEVIQGVIGNGELTEGIKEELSGVLAMMGTMSTNETGQEIFTLNEETKQRIQDVAIQLRETIVFLISNLPQILELAFLIVDGILEFIPSLISGVTYFVENWKMITAVIIGSFITMKAAWFAMFLAAQGVAMTSILLIAKAIGAILLVAAPWIAAIAGVVALVTLIVVKLKENQKFMEGWNSLTTALKNTWGNIVKQIGRLWTGIIAIVTQSSMWKDSISAIKAVWDGIMWTFTQIGNTLGAIVGWVASLYGATSEVNGEANILQDTVNIILGTVANISAFVEIVYEVLKFIVVEAAEFLLITSWINASIAITEGVFSGIKWLIEESVKGLGNFISNTRKSTSESELLKTTWQRIKDAMGIIMKHMEMIVTTLFPQLGIAMAAWQMGTTDIQTKTGGIESSFSRIGDSIKGLIQWTRDWINEFIPLDAILEKLGNQKKEFAQEGGSTSLAGVDMPPEIAAFIEMFRHGEGTTGDKGYTTMFTGKQFSDLSDHPRQLQTGSGITSDAAGVGQFLSTTWDGVAKQIGAKDFSKENQIKGILQLIKNRGAWDDLLNGRLDEALDKLSHEWASLPTSTTAQAGRYGQPAKTGSEAKRIYEQQLAKIRAGSRGSTSSVGGITAVDTGHVTGPSAFIGGSTEYHIDVKFDINEMSEKEMIAGMDQMARKYKSLGREIEFSNRGVEGLIWDADASMDKKIAMFRKVSDAHAPRKGRKAIDFYAPKIGMTREHESAVAAPIITPAFEGGKVQNYKNGKGYGAFSHVTNAAGKTVIEIGHGDNRKGKDNVIEVKPSRRGPVDTRGASFGPQDTRAKGLVVLPLDHSRTMSPGQTGAVHGGKVERDYQDPTAAKLKREFESQGLEVVILDPDKFNNYAEYDAELQRLLSSREVAISLPVHFDAIGGSYLTRTQAGDADDAALGREIQNLFESNLPKVSNTKISPADTVQNRTVNLSGSAPSALVEFGPMSDAMRYGSPEKYLESAEGKAAIAATVEGTMSFLSNRGKLGKNAADSIQESVRKGDSSGEDEKADADRKLSEFKRERERQLKQALSIIGNELDGKIATLENAIKLEQLKESPDTKRIAAMTDQLSAAKLDKSSRSETETLKSNIDIATFGKKAGAGDADLNDDVISSGTKRLKELGEEYKSAVMVNTAQLAKDMREALDKEAKEAFDEWKVIQGQTNESEDLKLSTRRAEEDALHREALLTATESEKTILSIKQSQIDLSRKAYDEIVKERRTLVEMEKLKELGVKQAQGYNIDQAIALSRQKIAEVEINHAREQRLMMAEKELEIHKALMETSKSLITAEFGSAISLPKTEIDEFTESLKALGIEQLKNTEEIAAQIQEIDDFITTFPSMDKERMDEQLQAKADLEMKHQLNALDADRKREYVEGKRSISNRSTAFDKEASMIGLEDQVNEAKAAALEASGSSLLADKLRLANDQRKEELRLKQALLDIEARRLEIESNPTLTPDKKAEELAMLEREVDLQYQLATANQKAIDIASSETAKAIQMTRKQAIDDLTTGLHDVLMGTKTLGEALTDVFKNLASMLVKMAAQRLMQRLFDGIGGGGGNNQGGGLGGILGALGGLLRRNDGGMVPYGSFKRGVDSVPAMLTPGEGVLTTKEIGLLGGPKGFESFRKNLRGYNVGGIVDGNRASGSISTLSPRTTGVSYKFETQSIGGMEVVTVDQLRGLEARVNQRTDSVVTSSQKGFTQRITNDVESRGSLGLPER